MALVVRAIHTFVAEHNDELDFQAGEDVEVLEKDEAFGDGWWRGRNARGEEGLFPATYIQQPEEPAATAIPAAVAEPPAAPAPAEPTIPAVDHSSEVVPQPVSPVVHTATLSSEPDKEVAPAIPATATTGSDHIAARDTPIGSTLGDIQNAIENIAQGDHEPQSELGIGQDTRARLAAQARLANEQRDRSGSGGVAGLVYSDESEDEDDDYNHRTSKSYTNGNQRSSTGAQSIGKQRVVSGSSIPAQTPIPTETVRTPIAPESSTLQPALPLPATPPGGRSVAPSSTESVPNWSVDEVVGWATSKGFDENICNKFREHEISGDLLLELDANLLKELDIPQFGKRLRIAQAIAELKRPNSVSSHEPSRGMSAPPSAAIYQSSASPPPLATPTSENGLPGGWSQSRRTSSTTPAMEAIQEGHAPVYDHSTSHTPISLPTSPATPNSFSTTKRESSGSLGHKKGKLSVDGKDRIGFFNRTRKPAPSSMSPGESWSSRLVSTGKVHQMQPATPVLGSAAGTGTALALQQIGSPDHSGFMKKKGERYGTWKTRFFVLKDAHLYYMKNEQEDRIKGHIDLRGLRVIVDENANPGSYGFRLVGGEKPHAFSSSEQAEVRTWMKALMKATIARDYNVPVTSSCNIPTIPLAEAQALSPRPPSPNTRAATQRANRRENTTQLTAHDASVLMSLDTTRRASQNLTPSRPSRDTRRPSTSSVAAAPPPAAIAREAPDSSREQALIAWVNEQLPAGHAKATSIESLSTGEMIFELVRSKSGIEPSPPVTADAFALEGGQPGVAGLFAMMDMLIDAGVDTAGVSLNEVRGADHGAICQLLESVKGWSEQSGHGQGLAQ